MTTCAVSIPITYTPFPYKVCEKDLAVVQSGVEKVSGSVECTCMYYVLITGKYTNFTNQSLQ